MKNLDKIAEDLFRKVRSRFSDIKLGDESGALTQEPMTARFFDVNFKANGEELGRVNIKLNDDNLTVIFSNSIIENQGTNARQEWFAFLKDMRQFAKSNLLTFDTRDITKSNLEKRDYEYLAKETGEPKMSESKLFGTSKTSYQDMGEAKIIVKHSSPVNYDNPAGRTQRIESIYIESSSGERFRYPHRHLNGARAMARHIANGGTAYDQMGSYISGLSEELGKLRQFKNYTQRSGLIGEALGDISSRVVERIDAVKQEIHNLQKQNYYESFKESFQPSDSIVVPEDVMQDWIDALTIKTFNEELTSVFPYIYKLVSEKQEGELRYDDLVAEEDQTDESEEEKDVSEHSLFSEFEEQLDTVSTFDYEIAEEEEEAREGNDFAEKVLALKARGAKPGTKFKTSDGEEHTLKDAIELAGMTVEDFWTTEELETENSAGISNEIVEFIASMYDRETGTFPRGEEGVKIAVEKKFGEQAGKFANFVVEKLSAKNEPAVQEEPMDLQAEPQNTELTRIKDLSGVKEAAAHQFKKGDRVVFKGKDEEYEIYGLAGQSDNPNTVYIRKPGTTPTQGALASSLELAKGTQVAQPTSAPKFKEGDTVEYKGEIYKVYGVDKDAPDTLYLQKPGETRTMGVWAGGGDVKPTESFEALDIIKSLAGI
jgi:hypothetical protein